MLPERPDRAAQDAAADGRLIEQDAQPVYVGAPSEYASEAEVPETVGLIAKILAGSVLAWSTGAIVLVLAGAGCALCVAATLLIGLTLR
ncbi:MAG: hypothetical protein HPY64_12555 [Anaerolineae bacterium]|nr:hypothetical protein [Anaerolineae bacterium]